MVATDELSQVFAALSSPVRRDMVDRLSVGTLTVGELGAPYSISAAAVSQNLGVLERAGLVERTARAQWREVSMLTPSLDHAAAWVDRHRADWEGRLDRLERRISELRAAER